MSFRDEVRVLKSTAITGYLVALALPNTSNALITKDRNERNIKSVCRVMIHVSLSIDYHHL